MHYKTEKTLVAVSDKGMVADIGNVLLEKGIEDFHVVHSMYEAVDLMLEHSFSCFVIDGQLLISSDKYKQRLAGVDFVRFIRMCDGPVSEASVIFLRSTGSVQNLLEAQAEIADARDSGASCIVSQPLTSHKFNEIIEPNLAQNRTFIRTANYVGPCRRRGDNDVTIERRTAQSPARRRTEISDE